ncbi:uncharacterized protein LOC34621146 [Cyclospora cayetanensis]|uniref:Uncharacterized protein LOC34621146 n=1 Tax=Cyclospora cayetanensis TaxID=88456 RepID=A0A6P6S0Y9_9EIME|nr:uncharacterized protein LOC34621146 [Cyclospora cayetanensis]
MNTDWKQLLLIAGGVAVTGVAAYYLLRDDGAASKERDSDNTKLNQNDATKEQVLMVLQDIMATQEKMKCLLKKFTQKFVDEECTFQEACSLVAKQNPEDPLARYGLTVATFDSLLDKFGEDPEVKDFVLSIMGCASAPNPSAAAYQITTERLIKVHEFMRDELQALAAEAGCLPKEDTKVIALAAQAYVGALVQKQFGLRGEDIEGAVMLNHKALAADAKFTLVNCAIQKTMNDLVDPES